MQAADVLVIGGGLVGCATAYHLAGAGASVVLAEAGQINTGASGRNAGSLHFQMERRFLENGAALADQAAQILALNRVAIEDWRGLEAELGHDLHVTMTGGLMVAETPDELKVLEAKSRREVAGGLDTRLINGDAARALEPSLSDTVLAAAHLPDEGHADPRVVILAFAAEAVARGARLHLETKVMSFRRVAGGYVATLSGPDGVFEIRAAKVLIAAGAWSAQIGALLNLHLPLYPVALLMNVTERAQPTLGHLIQHVGRRLSMKQAHAGNILIGGGWPSLLAQDGQGGFDLDRPATMIAASLKGNLEVASRIIPRVADLNLIRSWTGITAITADQLPLVGAVPQAPGVYVAAGGSAFTLGPTFARLLAGMMAGQDAAQLDVFAPARFNHLNSFMGPILA